MTGTQKTSSLVDLMGDIEKACKNSDFAALRSFFEALETLDVFKAASEEEKQFFPLLWAMKRFWQSFWFNLGSQNDLDIFDGSCDEELRKIFQRLGDSAESALSPGGTMVGWPHFSDAIIAYYELLEGVDSEL